MSDRIIIKNFENTETNIFFNKNSDKIIFEIYGDSNFYYNGSLESNSNNVIISFETPKDDKIFIKILEINGNKPKQTYTKFYTNTSKKISKNISMKIENINSDSDSDQSYSDNE